MEAGGKRWRVELKKPGNPGWRCAASAHSACCWWWWWWWWQWWWSVCARVCFAGGCRVYVFQQWYTATMNLLGTWLTERMDQQLHVYQLKILIRITKVGVGRAGGAGRGGGERKTPTLLMTYRRIHQPRTFALPLPHYRKSTGTSGCRGSSTRPSTARCTTRCATGWPWRRPRPRWGKEACRASPWRTAMRRTKRTTRAHTHRLPKPPPPALFVPLNRPLPLTTTAPFHTFDFSLVTDACTNSDSHSRTSSSARNAYEGTINYLKKNKK